MKPIHALILFMAGLLALLNSPLYSQENPPAEKSAEAAPPPPPAPPKPPPTETKGEEPDRPRGERPRPKSGGEEKLTAFIGVLTTYVSPELRAQFSLPEGFGLQVVEVMPDSPAKEAGLKEHDILIKFDDQKLVSMEQLQALVRSKKKDEQATFTVITGGKETQLTVKIGERMMPTYPEEGRRPVGRFFHSGSGGSDRPHFTPQVQENVERFQNRLKEFQERLQEWAQNGHRGPMPTPPVFDGPNSRDSGGRRPDARRNEPDRRGSSSLSSDQHRSTGVTRRDESGTYSLQRSGDHSVFSVRPNTGGEQSWSFSSDSQQNIVPEQYREKLRMLEEVSEDMRREGGPHGDGISRGNHREPGPATRDGDRRPPPPDTRPKGEPPAQSPPPSRSRETF